MRYHQIGVISGKGTGPDQFSEALNGLALDRAGSIHAAGDGQVKVFDAEGTLGRHWRTEKPGYCVAMADDGSVYVGEAGQVEVFSPTGERLATWRDDERLGFVTAIGFFGDHVLVADAQGRCLRRFDGNRKWLNDIGKDNNTKGFLIPNGHLDFAIDAQGIIHAANPGKHRVERYTLSGESVGHFGKFGGRRPEDFPGCCNPTNLALTRQGHVVVTEKAGPRLKVYDAAGKLLALVGAEAFDANCRNMDVVTDPQGRVYVVDTVRLSILVFALDESDKEIDTGTTDVSESPAAQGDTKP